MPQFVGLTFGIYNRKKFLRGGSPRTWSATKLGEFPPTRTFTGHAADKKAKRLR